MHAALRPIFNKGGIGPAMDRAETADRLRLFADRYLDLLNSYDAALAHLTDGALVAALTPEVKRARVELSKLYETIYSMGTPAGRGVDREPSAYDLGATDAARVHALNDLERSLRDDLKAEIKLNHHIRTVAILNHCLAGSERRVGVLFPAVSRLSRG